MNHIGFEEFSKNYRQKKAQILWRRIVADLDTPVGAYLKLSSGKKNSFLLESVEGGETKGRFSMIGLDPDIILKTKGNKVEISTKAPHLAQNFIRIEQKPLDALREFVNKSQANIPPGLPPNSAGIFGYLGYEMVRQMEELPKQNKDELNNPDAILMRPSLLAIFDNLKDELYLSAPIYYKQEISAKQAWELAQERLDEANKRLEKNIPYAKQTTNQAKINITSNTDKEQYLAMVQRAKQYIRAGDIFQVVLSQRFESEFTLPPSALYRALRRTNPSPYMYFLDFEDFSIAGSSPEILVRVDKNRKITIRPIAGTRKRGNTPERDKELANELLSDPKELAEHLMLLDLGRNDVGRVAKIGSVKVSEKFFLEYYSHVMHIVSNVVGILDDKYDFVDALSAGFPAGTVSGAPKVRAMQIIDELEKSQRGIYGGCVGYFGADGTMDSCIVLRTAIIKNNKLYVQAGAGIVADSKPELEQKECENKARALFSAASEAIRYANEAEFGQ